MTATLSATDVRGHWGQFNDDVIRKGPRFVKRNRDEWAAMSKEHLRVAFSTFTFKADVFAEENGSTTLSLKGFDLVENGEDYAEALELLAEAIVEYAEDYMNEFDLYQRDINRTKHFPYLMNALAQPDIDSVVALIDAEL